jgi:hypothetical protein
MTDGKSYFASAAAAGAAPSGGSERRYATIAFRSLGSIFAYRPYGMNGRSCRPLRLTPVVIAFLISSSVQLPRPASLSDVMFADTAAQS